MNREQAKALLPIITAYAEGKEIQVRKHGEVEWTTPPSHLQDHGLTFDPNIAEWRIKPKTKIIGYGVILWDDGRTKNIAHTNAKATYEHWIKSPRCIRIIQGWKEWEEEVSE